MQKLILALCLLVCTFTFSARNNDNEVRTLVVKTNDGNVAKFNISDIAELTFDSEPAESVRVTRLLNLTPDFISVIGLEENQTLTAGSRAIITLKAGPILGNTFQDYHFEHIHLQVNEQVIVPQYPDDYTPSDELVIPFDVPGHDCDIVVCYSGQQQMIDNGFTMTLEPNSNVTMYGVAPDMHYKYFDAFLLVDEAFVITNAEFKMGNDEWKPVNGTAGCRLSRDETVDNLYQITIRPDYQNVTGNVLVRVSGEQHARYTISWENAVARYLDLEKSTLPEMAIDGDVVVAELYINDDFYLKGATSAEAEVETLYGVYVRFTMPAANTTVVLDMADKIPVTINESGHVADAAFYNAPDIYYGWPITLATPGESAYIIASAEAGYKPMSATTGSGDTFRFSHYGLDMYLCEVPIPADATLLSASIECAPAWTVSSEQVIQCSDGALYAEGETVSLSIQVPAGKTIDSVKAATASGHSLDVTVDAPYASFVMPADDVTVTVTYADLESGNTVSVIAYYDDNLYDVSSSTNYDWDFAEGFSIDKGTTFYLSVYDYSGESFYVGVKIGDSVQTYSATEDEDTGEYTFGKAFVATGDVTIKVGATKESVSFESEPVADTVSVIAYYDEDQYRVKSSTNYDWNFAEGFTTGKDTSFYVTVQDDYGEAFYVGVKIGDNVQTYAATEDEDTGEYTFGKSLVATGDVIIKVGATESSVAF